MPKNKSLLTRRAEVEGLAPTYQVTAGQRGEALHSYHDAVPEPSKG